MRLWNVCGWNVGVSCMTLHHSLHQPPIMPLHQGLQQHQHQPQVSVHMMWSVFVSVCFNTVVYSFVDGSNLWHLLDSTVSQRRGIANAEAEAIVEVQRYLAEQNLPRQQDPLLYWHTQKHLYPHLYKLALQFLCTPASSVPCERVFSKAGEVISKKRNRLSPNTVKILLFLNKNQ